MLDRVIGGHCRILTWPMAVSPEVMLAQFAIWVLRVLFPDLVRVPASWSRH